MKKEDQPKLFDDLDELTWWKKEWQDMPEFIQDDLLPVKQLIISFDNYEDYFKFGKLIDQNLTKQTKSVWHPKIKKTTFSDKRYIQDDEK